MKLANMIDKKESEAMFNMLTMADTLIANIEREHSKVNVTYGEEDKSVLLEWCDDDDDGRMLGKILIVQDSIEFYAGPDAWHKESTSLYKLQDVLEVDFYKPVTDKHLDHLTKTFAYMLDTWGLGEENGK